MNKKNHRFVLGSAALLTASLLFGCASDSGKGQSSATLAAAPAAPAPQAQTAPEGDRPGGVEGELVVINAKVKAVDKKNRLVTLKFEDGQEKKIKCGPEVRNFPQIRVGDDVKAQFLETVELFVTGAEEPAAERKTEVQRAPLGSKPAVAAIDAVEVKATVDAIDYQSRDVTLKGPEGKILKVKAGPEVKRLNEVKQGDTVVARLTRAMSIEVTTPGKGKQ